LVSVGFPTANPPQSHVTSSSPNGSTPNRFVITVAAQNLIYPHGRTYPKNAIAILITYIITPTTHTAYAT